MDNESRSLLDDLDVGQVIEIEYLVGGRLRYSIGPYESLVKDVWNNWIVRRINRPDIRTIDIQTIRRVSNGKA